MNKKPTGKRLKKSLQRNISSSILSYIYVKLKTKNPLGNLPPCRKDLLSLYQLQLCWLYLKEKQPIQSHCYKLLFIFWDMKTVSVE